MSFVKLNQNNFAMTSVILNADRKFVSSSTGITGALKVIVDRSYTQKDNIDDRFGLTGENAPQPFGENTYEGRRKIIMDVLRVSGSNVANVPHSDWFGTNNGEFELAQLLDGSGIFAGVPPPEYEKYGIEVESISETGYSDISMHPRNSTELLIRVLKPTSSILSSGSMALAMAERILEPYYLPTNAALGSKFVNFSCMNFFDAAGIKQALVYPSYQMEINNSGDLEYRYRPAGDFSLEFWIKLRDTTKTGTIIHNPGYFSVSILSGSETNENGYPTTYALGCAFKGTKTRTKTYTPYNIDFGTDSYTEKSTFNLKKDVWTHCAITFDNSLGEVKIYFNGQLDKISKIQHASSYNTAYHRALILGSYWNGAAGTETNDLGYFSKDIRQGTGIYTTTADNLSPSQFDCQLNADLHEIRMWDKIITGKDINVNMYSTYTGSFSDHRARKLLFYVPCLYDVDYKKVVTHFIKPKLDTGRNSSNTTLVSDLPPAGFEWNYDNQNSSSYYAKKMLTGSISSDISTLGEIFSQAPGVHIKQLAAPYQTNHANIGNFANVNIQSFVKDYANIAFPVCHDMSESLGAWRGTSSLFQTQVTETFSEYTTSHILTSSFTNRLTHQARNCFILPCDNGLFKPNYKTLIHPTGSKYLQKDGFYINTKNIGNINDILDTRLFFIDDVFAANESFVSPAEGSTTTQGADDRYNNGIELFAVLDADYLQNDIPNFSLPSLDDGEFTKTFDASDFPGPLTTIITIPQLYYGRRIKPGSIRLSSYLYNGNQAKIELRDNGEGILYRHQSTGSNANWNKVGDVYYGEGLIYIRHPSLYAIGSSNIDIEFKSESQVNVYEASIPCAAQQFNSSSNPNYNKLLPSNNDNESADEFVYISTVYLHDENLNVVGKAKLAQPIIKRPENKYMFRVKLDY